MRVSALLRFEKTWLRAIATALSLRINLFIFRRNVSSFWPFLLAISCIFLHVNGRGDP